MGLSRACLLFVFHFTTVFSADLTSQCQCPENIDCGNSATVRCNFNEDVYTLAKSFIVVKFPINATANEGGEDIVVYCSAVNKGLDCEVEDGYKLHLKPGLTQTLHIANATTKAEGRYACQYLTSKPQKFQTCTLRVQEANIQDDSKTEKENSVDRGGDQETDGQGGDSSAHDNVNPVTIGIGIGIGVTVAAVAAFVFGIVRRKRSPLCLSTTRVLEVEDEKGPPEEKKNLVEDGHSPENASVFCFIEEKMKSNSSASATPNGPSLSDSRMDRDLQQKVFSNSSHDQSSDSSADGNEYVVEKASTWPAVTLRAAMIDHRKSKEW